ncbi:MAG: SpoIID/LytB domain-containing protein [Desulforegulaceae bacterium]|nr:SpoIID/LytB domain-containing protein [Desulforegulaceae bacterium]
MIFFVKLLLILSALLIPVKIFSQSLYIQSLERAREYIIENNIEKALNEYLSITSSENFDKEKKANALLLYSLTLWKKLNDTQNSKSAFENVLKNFPDTEASGDALFYLAEIEAQNKNYKKSEKYLEFFVSNFPDHIRIEKVKERLHISNNFLKTDNIPVKILLGTAGKCSFFSGNSLYADFKSLKSNRIDASISKSGTIIINGKNSFKKKIILSSPKEPLIFQNTRYTGKIILNQKNEQIEVINVLDLGSYLKSVVPSEMPDSWHHEALKAQAVASRTYALFMIWQNKNNSYHLESGIISQVYKGIENICINSSLAVEETDSQFILFENKPVLAAFHSNSGGFTDDPIYFWQKNYSYLKSKQDRFSPLNEWSVFFSYDELSKLLFSNSLKIKKVWISEKTPSGRVTSLSFKTDKGNFFLSGEKLRAKTGFYLVKSTLFGLKNTKTGIEINGRGFGHGIGMSQWGAKIMAEKGYNYKDIVNYYYSDNIKIEKKLPESLRNDPENLFLTKLF